MVTKIVRGTVTEYQKKAINSLIGIIGANEQDVVGKILILWLHQQGFLINNQK